MKGRSSRTIIHVQSDLKYKTKVPDLSLSQNISLCYSYIFGFKISSFWLSTHMLCRNLSLFEFNE